VSVRVGIDDLPGRTVIRNDTIGEIGVESIHIHRALRTPKSIHMVEIKRSIVGALGLQLILQYHFTLAGNEGMVFGE